jgi:cell division protein FtsB
MAKRKKVPMKQTRLEARIRVIQGAEKLAFILFCSAIGFVVFATSVPQRRELARLEGKLKLAKELETNVKREEENCRDQYQALREDPAFLENHARDRLDYYREGERVLKFRD